MSRHASALLAAAAVLASCRPAPRAANMLAADLINDFPHAECRPAEACEPIRGPDGPAIRAASPSRLTWVLPLPRDGRLETTVRTSSQARVRFRIGVSDGRTYEQLAAIELGQNDPAQPLLVDLSAYAGRKWSLFYRPDRIAWRLTLSEDAIGGVAGAGMWGAPRVMTTRTGEAEYLRRTGRR